MSNSNALRRLWRLCLGFKGSLNRLNRYGHSWVEREDRISVAKTGYGKSVVPLASYYKELYCHYPAAVECT